MSTPTLIGPQLPHANVLIDSLNTNGFALDMSETGTGKTFVAAYVAHVLGRPVVIICPKTVIPAWTKVLALFGIKPTALINYELIGRGNTKWMKWKRLPDLEAKPNTDAALKKVEVPFFKFSKDSLVILDEGHRCKGQDTTNSKMLISLTSQGYRTLVASATVACSPLEMKAVGYLTKLHALHDFKNFCTVYGAGWLGKFGAMVWDAGSNEAKKAMALLNHYLFREKKCASRMTREDFGDLFPESHIVADAYDLGSNTAKIQKVYDDMEYELAKLDEQTENYSEHVFAIIMEARRRAEMCKVPMFVEMIEDLFDEGKSVGVFVNFTETVHAISKRLEKSKKFRGMIGYIVGGQDAKKRQADIDDFQNDVKRIIICNIAAGGVGVSLHDVRGAFPRAAVISPTWSHVNFQQTLGRVWRVGGLSKSFQRICYAAKCIEETICRKVQDKLNCLNVLHDGDLCETIAWLACSHLDAA